MQEAVMRGTQEMDLDEEMAELSSAEEFLDFFGVAYETRVVQVSRLHILQRFHDYLAQAAGELPEAPGERWSAYRALLARAYQDFLDSDPHTEKVFRVFQQAANAAAFVPIEQIGQGAEGDADGV